jgi:hypothetical protein
MPAAEMGNGALAFDFLIGRQGVFYGLRENGRMR